MSAFFGGKSAECWSPSCAIQSMPEVRQCGGMNRQACLICSFPLSVKLSAVWKLCLDRLSGNGQGSGTV